MNSTFSLNNVINSEPGQLGWKLIGILILVAGLCVFLCFTRVIFRARNPRRRCSCCGAPVSFPVPNLQNVSDPAPYSAPPADMSYTDSPMCPPMGLATPGFIDPVRLNATLHHRNRSSERVVHSPLYDSSFAPMQMPEPEPYRPDVVSDYPQGATFEPIVLRNCSLPSIKTHASSLHSAEYSILQGPDTAHSPVSISPVSPRCSYYEPPVVQPYNSSPKQTGLSSAASATSGRDGAQSWTFERWLTTQNALSPLHLNSGPADRPGSAKIPVAFMSPMISEMDSPEFSCPNHAFCESRVQGDEQLGWSHAESDDHRF